MRKLCLGAVLLFAWVLVGCQPAPTELPPLPTLDTFPTETETPLPSATATLTETPLPTNTSTETLTPTETTIPTETLTPSTTPTPSNTPVPSNTPDATAISMGTSTAIAQEAPVLSTFTPLPPGAVALVARPTSTGTPEVVADVIITAPQFQEEVDRLLDEEDNNITVAQVNLVEEGVEYQLTAESTGVFVTGTVTVPFTFSGGGFNNIITIGGAITIEMADGNEPPENYLLSVNEIVLITQESFNFILNQRLGEGNHNLETITIEDNRMLISLLVPEPADE